MSLLTNRFFVHGIFCKHTRAVLGYATEPNKAEMDILICYNENITSHQPSNLLQFNPGIVDPSISSTFPLSPPFYRPNDLCLLFVAQLQLTLLI